MKKSTKFFFLILFFTFILTAISSCSPPVSATDNMEYISATDILKNFKFESIGGEEIVDDGAFDNKLRFDTQASWLLFKDDVIPLATIESEGSTILKYRMVLRNKINIFTNVRLNQMAQNMLEINEKFLGATYRHLALGGHTRIYWQEYIEWDHWHFGDIYNYNFDNNYFNGRIVMSFDIDDNPIPDTFGEYTEKEFDHIAVSDAGIITNTYGNMSDDMPEIIALSPSEVESETKDDYLYTPGPTTSSDYSESIDPQTILFVLEHPTKSFDASIVPDTAGSSMNPTNKDGTPIWDPEAEEKSMTGCLINYDLNSISPIVYKYTGVLSWIQWDLETEDYLVWDYSGIHEVVKTNHRYRHAKIKYRDVALHGINRYLQVDMYVAFDVWTSVKLGTLTEQYEYLRLHYPEEYYDELIWSTLAGGWHGSQIEEYGAEWFDIQWLDDIFNFFGGFEGIITLILIIAGVAIGAYIFLKIGIPLMRRKRM